MSHTIFIKDLTIEGIHGSTNTTFAKVFALQIEVSVEEIALAAATDDIAHVFDYRNAIAIAERIITGPPVHLIETLAVRIADGILELPKAQKIKLTLSKRENGDTFDSGIMLERPA